MTTKLDILTYAEAWENVGGLSSPSKMPCYGWSLSAKICKTGSKLRKIANSVCSKCYALRGNYAWPFMQKVMEKRLLASRTSRWVPSMVYLIKSLNQLYFRWFDSGDIQNETMLNKIVLIVLQCPETKFWLPTKEYAIVRSWLSKGNIIPSNLNIRLSGYMIDQDGPNSIAAKLGVTASEVRTINFTCPSSKQSNFCGTCRACWDRDEKTVIYKKH